MTGNSGRAGHFALVIVCLSVIIGGWLRLSGLDTKCISHIEMYVPGIRMPEGLSEPRERLTVGRILTGTFSTDAHPPGYYLVMLPWTQRMGTSLRALRLPTALLGTACIPLVYGLGALIGAPVAGAVGAALIAVNGYHVFWSKVARMYPLACFLGLATSILLLLIARGYRRRGILTAIYVVLILAGVTTHIYFWTLFATHMIWSFGNAWGRRELPDLCRAQWLALVLGSPLIAFAAYQSGSTISNLSNNTLAYLTEFVSFAFVFPSSQSGVFPSTVPLTGTALFWVVRGVLGLIAGFLLLSGLRYLWRSPSTSRSFADPPSGRFLWSLSWIAAGVVATLEIICFLYMTRQEGQIHNSIKITEFLSVLPLALTAVALLLDRKWGGLPPPGRWKRLVDGERALMALLAIAPFAMLAALSQFRPLLYQRGLLFASPYLLLLLAVGLVSLRRKAWIAALLLVLVLIYAVGLTSYGDMTVDGADYNKLAAAVKSELKTGDLVFIRKAWYVTPILYYLHADEYHLVGPDYSSYALACVRNPAARVWVVLINNLNPTDAMQRALSDYDPIRTIIVPHAKAILYRRSAKPAE